MNDEVGWGRDKDRGAVRRDCQSVRPRGRRIEAALIWALLMKSRRASLDDRRYALFMIRRGMTLRASAGLGTGAALAVAVLLEVAAPGVARAQNLLCASHSLSRDDASRLKVAARAVVPTSEVFVMGACRNPGRALGFVETNRTFTSERVKQWRTLSCTREEQDWTCDPPEFKQSIKLSLSIGHAERHVVLAFDQQTPLDRAKSLTSRALSLYADPKASLESCSSDGLDDQRWQALHWQYRGQFERGPIHVTVYREHGRDTVTLDDISVNIRFSVNPGEAAGPSKVCWEEFIVVT